MSIEVLYLPKIFIPRKTNFWLRPCERPLHFYPSRCLRLVLSVRGVVTYSGQENVVFMAAVCHHAHLERFAIHQATYVPCEYQYLKLVNQKFMLRL